MTFRRPRPRNRRPPKQSAPAGSRMNPNCRCPDWRRRLPQVARINVRPKSDPEAERLRAVLTETLRELEALRSLLT